MKGIFIVCIAVIGGLFLYQPQMTDETEKVYSEKNNIAPELLECQYYKVQIEKNIKEAKKK